MADIHISFVGPDQRLAIAAAKRAQEAQAGGEGVLEQVNDLLGSFDRAGTFGERDAIPLASRKRGMLFHVVEVLEDDTIFRRTYEWRVVGDPSGPLANGPARTTDGWEGLLTEAERKNLNIQTFGVLPAVNVAGLVAGYDDLTRLYKVEIGDFRARMQSGKAKLTWNLFGIKPDSQTVSWGGFSVTLDGGVTEFEPQDWTASRPLFILGNSLSDITDVSNRWSQLLAASLGVTLTSVARYSSDPRQVYRAGLEPLNLTVASNTLPVGGTPANVTAINGVETSDPDFIAYPQSFLNITAGNGNTTGMSMTGWISSGGQARHVTVSITNGGSTDYRIVQDAGQTALTLSGPVLFKPDASFALRGARTGIWVGQNYFYSGVPNFYGDHTNPQMFTDIAKMVGATQGGPAFILPIIPNADWQAEGSPIGPINGVEYGFHGRAAMAAANARLEALYPNLYLRNGAGQDLNDWLQAHGDGSSGDNADIAAGYTPRSLRLSGDGLHLNAAGDALVVEFVEDALAVQDTPPAVVPGTTVFALRAVGTQNRFFPDDPITFEAGAITRLAA